MATAGEQLEIDPADSNEPSCSFCGRPRSQVGRLIAGPRAFICDRCIRLSYTIIEEEDRGTDPADLQHLLLEILDDGK